MDSLQSLSKLQWHVFPYRNRKKNEYSYGTKTPQRVKPIEEKSTKLESSVSDFKVYHKLQSFQLVQVRCFFLFFFFFLLLPFAFSDLLLSPSSKLLFILVNGLLKFQNLIFFLVISISLLTFCIWKLFS